MGFLKQFSTANKSKIVVLGLKKLLYIFFISFIISYIIIYIIISPVKYFLEKKNDYQNLTAQI